MSVVYIRNLHSIEVLKQLLSQQISKEAPTVLCSAVEGPLTDLFESLLRTFFLI